MSGGNCPRKKRLRSIWQLVQLFVESDSIAGGNGGDFPK